MRRLLVTLAIATLAWLSAQATAASALDQRATWPKTEEFVALPPPQAAPLLSLGYRELMADLTWCRALVYYGSNLTGENDLRYLEKFIDTILALDPRFERVYRWASYAVTFKAGDASEDEYLRSIRYLERGMAEFPDGYELPYLAGLHYYLDLKPADPNLRKSYQTRGADLIEQAMHKADAPQDLAVTAAGMRTKLGQKERGLRDLREMILTTDDEDARQMLLGRVSHLGDDGIAEELEAARDAFDQARRDNLPNLPADLMVLLGPRPDPRIDFRKLATDRDLFGAEDPTELWP